MREEIRKRADMIRRGDVPEGYKETKVGVIPEEWEVNNLGELSTVTKLAGFEYSKYFNSYKDKGTIIVIRGTNITHNKLNLSDIKTIPIEVSKKLNRSQLKKGDLVFAYVGTIGPVYMIQEDMKYHLGPNTSKISTNKKMMPKYLFEYFKSSYIKSEIKAFTSIGAQPSLSMTKIRKFQIIVPTIIEQTTIANILTSADKAIETTETLISLKQKKKKWLMQNLLTGKVRLPGFKNPWKKFKLGNLFKERNERKQNSIYELLSITSEKGVQKRTEIDRKDNSSHDKSKYKVIYQNDIGYNTMRMWQGVSGVSYYKGIISPAYTVLAPREGVHSIFMGYLFKLPKTINLFKRYSQGLVNDTLSLKYANFKKIVVLVPEYDEQTAIANILSTADKEITLLHQKLDTLKQQKKALMQLLLTGIVRTTGLTLSSDTEEEGVAYVR